MDYTTQKEFIENRNTRQELISQIYNEKYKISRLIYEHTIESEKEIKKLKRKIARLKKEVISLCPEIKRGNTYDYKDFSDSLTDSYRGKSDTAQKIFLSNNHRLEIVELKILKKVVGNDENIYNYFNKIIEPYSIVRTQIDNIKEEVKSNNIYDKMAAPEKTKYKVLILLGCTDNNIKLVHEYWEDTTLNRSDIVSFMRF